MGRCRAPSTRICILILRLMMCVVMSFATTVVKKGTRRRGLVLNTARPWRKHTSRVKVQRVATMIMMTKRTMKMIMKIMTTMKMMKILITALVASPLVLGRI
ncbi:unnamed protein product [Brassica oleracea]